MFELHLDLIFHKADFLPAFDDSSWFHHVNDCQGVKKVDLPYEIARMDCMVI